MKMYTIGQILKKAGIKFWEDNGPRLSASITFYLALYLSPLLLTVIAIVGLGFDPQEARGKIVEEIRGVVGQEVAVVIEQLVAQSAISNHGIWSGIIAAITLFIGSTGLFSS